MGAQRRGQEEKEEMKQKKIIYFLIGIIAGIIIGVGLIGSGAIAKTIKEPLGKWYISTYSAHCNTPSGTHNTSSGAYATAGRTAAVDLKNPLVPMGSWIYIDGIGKRHVEDYGGFGRYNSGRRAVDVFTDGSGYLVERRVWLLRPETKKEIKKRKAKERKKREAELEKKRRAEQRKPFVLVYDPALLPWQIVTDKDIIPSGTVLVEWSNMMFQWLDVARTEKGIGHVIKIGNRAAVMCHTQIRLQDVIEGAVG